MIELDSNVLLRYVNTLDVDHVKVTNAIRFLSGQGEDLCFFPQNVYEFWSASTRPLSSNGLGYSVQQAEADVALLKIHFRFLPDPPDLYDRWEALVVAHQCKGKPAHDARIVAAMDAHGITSILTFNTKDLARYPHLTVLDPVAVVP